jgi:preprotein translocase subunit SecA
MKRMNADENSALEGKSLMKAIERAQRGIEGRNFEIRKNVIKYDDTINEQRKVIYAERNKVLDNENLDEQIQEIVKRVITEAAEKYLYKNKDYYGYLKSLYTTFMPENTLLIPGMDEMGLNEIIEYTYEISRRVYDLKKMSIGIEKLKELERKVLLEVVDSYWIEHIDAMDQLRQVIGLAAIGQKDPVKEYAIQGYDMFEELNKHIRNETVKYLYKFE